MSTPHRLGNVSGTHFLSDQTFSLNFVMLGLSTPRRMARRFFKQRGNFVARAFYAADNETEFY